MGKIIIIFLLIINTVFVSYAQNKVSTDAVTTDKYGNIYVAGTFEGAIKADKFLLGSEGSNDAYFAKFNKNGVCQWISSAGGKNYDAASGIAVDKDGYVYVCGSFTDTASFDYITLKGKGDYAFIAKYNPSGDIIWVKKSNGANALDIGIDGSNYVYVTGYFSGSASFEKEVVKSNGDADGFIAKYTPNGKIDWAKHFGGMGKDMAMSIDIVPGSIIVGGTFSSSATFSDRTLNGSGNDGFLANYSTSGTLNWLANSGVATKSAVYDVKFTKNNNIVSAWQCSSKSALESTVQLNSGSDGATTTKKTFDGISYPTGIISNEKDEVFVTGSYQKKLILNNDKIIEPLESEAGFDFYIAKINTKNNVEWCINSGFNKDDAGQDITIDNEKNIIALGEFAGVAKFNKTELTNSGNFCIYLSKINPNGEVIWAKKAIEPEPNFEANTKKFRSIYAKLLVGEGEKKSIINQTVNLKSDDGEVIRTTTTDVFGDFSFKAIEEGKQVNIEIEKNSDVKDEVIYIANQSGNVITKVQRDKNSNFSYTMLPQDINTLVAMPEEENPTLKIKDFKKSVDNAISISQNIYFESGSIKISKEEEKKIAEIAKILRSNPTYFVEIIAYTDADGDDNGNLVLSEKRAKMVADIVITKGVKLDKVSSKGLGESKILNRCVNGIECSDKEKMLNRRTEFVISKLAPQIETAKKKGK